MSDEGAPVSVSERNAGFEGVPFWRTLKWLGAGALLYALLLLVAMAGSSNDTTWLIVGPSLYLTPVFGLPYVVASFDLPGRTRRLVYFLLCVPLAYAGAKYLTLNYATEHFDLFEPGRDLKVDLIAGALGGLAGAALAFGSKVAATPAARNDRRGIAASDMAGEVEHVEIPRVAFGHALEVRRERLGNDQRHQLFVAAAVRAERPGQLREVVMLGRSAQHPIAGRQHKQVADPILR